MKKTALAKEFDYYVEHQDELADKYDGQYVVIVKNSVVGVYKTLEQAVRSSEKKYKLGKFFVHLVGRGEENYTTVFRRAQVGNASQA